MREKVFVVEGAHDKAKLLEIDSNLNVVITNGSEISSDTISLLKKLDETCDLILFLDPDYAGEKIRSVLVNELKNYYHVFLDQNKAFSKNKRKIGIEHASKEDLLNAIEKMYNKNKKKPSDLTTHFLFELGLIGQENSKDLRDKLSDKLYLGKTNGKTLLKRLILFGINKNELVEALNDTSS